MFEPMVNYWAVLVSALVFFGIGAVWYGPIFGKIWMESVGVSEESLNADKENTNMVLSFGLMLVSALLMALVMGHLIDYMLFIFPKSGALSVGLTTAIWSWLGFVLAYLLTAPAFERRPWSYVFVNGGYWLVGMLATGLIIGAWR